MPSMLTAVAALACWACAGLGRRVPTSSVRTYEISHSSYEEQQNSLATGDTTDSQSAVHELRQSQSSCTAHVLHRLKVLGMLLLALNNMAAGWHASGHFSMLGHSSVAKATAEDATTLRAA